MQAKLGSPVWKSSLSQHQKRIEGKNCFCQPLTNTYLKLGVSGVLVKFIAENTRPLMKQPSERKSGIGTENLRNRLSLSFNEDYSMDVLEKDNLYRTELIINHAKKHECTNR